MSLYNIFCIYVVGCCFYAAVRGEKDECHKQIIKTLFCIAHYKQSH